MAAKQQVSTTSSTKKDFTTIKKCSCKHEFQDSEHGLNMRVMNSCRGGTDVRCTVCNSTTKV
jgi:LSD1 subclass zinc finger protein